MAFLDDIDKKLTILGQGAIQKTKEVSDTAKMSGIIRTLETQKKECFVELGKLFYLTHQESASDQEKVYIDKINKLDVQIKESREQMCRLKGTIYCPNCNAEIPANSLFCNVCGAKIERKNAESEVFKGNVCGQCGSPLEDDQMFCIHCGAKVSRDYEYVAAEVSEEKISDLVCPNCAEKITEDQMFCINCGTALK